MLAFLERMVEASYLPGDDDLVTERKRLLIGAALTAPVLLLAIGSIYLAYGEWVAGGAYCGFAAWIWLNLAAFLRFHRRVDIAFWVTGVAALCGHLVVILSLGDIEHSGGLVLWGLAYPVATAPVFIRVRWAFPLFALYTVNVLVTVFSSHQNTRVPSGVERGILAANFLSLSAFAVAVIALFVNQRDDAHRLLGEEQRRARALLLSILPEEIADELSQSPRVIAEQFESVSVLFADVVGFTPMAATMEPVELVELLDDLFARFDELVAAAGLEKIKTIGDCYMVAAGIPRPRDDHANALVTLALNMQAVARREEFRGRHLQLRIGINSGPVVAGVIGRRKFSYDLWGDVVNTASRMESYGVPGEVQLTDATRTLVEQDFACESRGSIEVRGKGALPVWLVTGPA